MAHRLLERYPKLDGNFLFLDVNVVIPKYLYPLLPACAEDGGPQIPLEGLERPEGQLQGRLR